MVTAAPIGPYTDIWRLIDQCIVTGALIGQYTVMQVLIGHCIVTGMLIGQYTVIQVLIGQGSHTVADRLVHSHRGAGWTEAASLRSGRRRSRPAGM